MQKNIDPSWIRDSYHRFNLISLKIILQLDFFPGNQGNFSVSMGSFSDSGFLSSTSEQYPVFKSIEDRINIQYSVSTRNTDIVVRAETCRATPTNNPYDRPQYMIISE